jgi:hypothetical protein
VLPLLPDAPVILPGGDTATIHEKVVPVTLLPKAMDVALPEQTASDDGVADATGLGFTVITTFVAVPVQLLAVAVTA